MAADEKWYFTKEQLLQSPSRKSGYDVDKELSSRQQAANFIQDMGQRLQVSQLCINTAIVYMHRFYVFHSLASFHRNAIAAAALFLAAKVEEQPRKLEHVIKVAHICLHRENPNLDIKSEAYLEQAQDLVFNENVLLQTLGFDVAIDHPHTHVVRCCHLVRASKDLAQTSYFMASNSLHLTTMCLQYKPTVVACFCIHLACKWSNWEIPRSNEGKDWFWYVDKTVTLELLEQLTGEFLAIFDKCPTKLKRKMMSMNQNNTSGFTQASIPHDGLQFEEPRKLSGTEAVKPPEGLFPVQKQNSQLPSDKPSSSSSSSSSSSTSNVSSHPHHQKIDYREYREKKERERLEREKQQQHHHHQQQRDAHGNVSSNSHHHSKGGTIATKGPPSAQSRSSGSSAPHKSYQSQSHAQANVHFQNVKESSDSGSAQGYQVSREGKDNYLKQHPPHSEREAKDTNYHGQYSQSSNIQHQNYSHKSESSYSHRDGSRTNHGNQMGGSGAQSHHGHSHNSSNQSMMGTQRDFGVGGHRDGVKDNLEMQGQKKDMSSSIRDIIGQTLPQTDPHSMTNERKEVREKSRGNYAYGNAAPTSNRAELLKNGREQSGKAFHEPLEKKGEEMSQRSKERLFKKEDDELVIDAKKMEAPCKTEKFDESEAMEGYSGAGSGAGMNNWSGYDFGFNLSNVKSEKKELAGSGTKGTDAAGVAKTEVDSKGESVKSDMFSVGTEKSQAVHTARGIYDSKYKTHHYPSGNKNSDASQFKNEKQSAQCSSDLTKKFNDRMHDKMRKGEPDRISHLGEQQGHAGEKHHKLNKEMQDKHKMLIPGQQHIEPKSKDRSSPSKYANVKTASRSSGLDYLKSDSGHFNLDVPVGGAGSGGASESDKNDKNTSNSHKPTHSDDSSAKGMGNFKNFHKQQKAHEFGALGSLTSSLPDANAMKSSSKTSSIFSPDSKISPQNILSSLEKDSTKSSTASHRGHSSSKASPTSAQSNVKPNVPSSLTVNTSNAGPNPTGSLFSPPLPKPSQSTVQRHRTSSSGSEPELIPVLTKIEDTPGYENIIREKKIALSIPGSDKVPVPEASKQAGSGERGESTVPSLFDFDLKGKEKSAEPKASQGRGGEASQFPTAAKQSASVKLPGEIRSDLGAVIYPNNPKSVPVSKSSQSFNLAEPKLSLSNSVSTVNLSGIEKMVDTSISPAKQTNAYGAQAPSTLKSNVNINFGAAAGSNAFVSGPCAGEEGSIEKGDPSLVKVGAVLPGNEIIDVEDVGHGEGKKKSEKKKKKEKHKHKDKDRSERKKEKKKHKEKDKERSKDKEKHKEKEKSKERDKYREREIDVVNSEASVGSEAPIKITIPKDKISGGLKIKIPKECLKKEGAGDAVDSPKTGTSGELKIKISKDKFSHVGTYKEESTKSGSKKRDRSPKSSVDLPHPKQLKTSDKMKSSSSSSSRSNGTDGSSSRHSTSHRHSVSENGSYIDISNLYDFPFDFEENGDGIVKTPDYDFEALDRSEYANDGDDHVLDIDDGDDNTIAATPPTMDDVDDMFRNSQNDSEITDTPPPQVADFKSPKTPESPVPAAEESLPKSAYVAHPESGQEVCPPVDRATCTPLPQPPCPESTATKSQSRHHAKDSIDPDDYVLKNYKSILDSHSKWCDVPKSKSEESRGRAAKKPTEQGFETESPNYYNKYFKRDGNPRPRSKDDVKTSKSRDDRAPPRFHDKFTSPNTGHRYRGEYSERKEERRHYRDFREYPNPEYAAESQYYFEGGMSDGGRCFDYHKYPIPGHFFVAGNGEPDMGGTNVLTYDVNANESATSLFSRSHPETRFLCDSSSISGNPLDVNMQHYQYGYYNNYMYTGGGEYRFYGGAVPFVNMSVIEQQQPIPPGTGEMGVQLGGPPPLPLEPPPDLPPPPQTPPPKPSS